jgi:hypothetical protein
MVCIAGLTEIKISIKDFVRQQSIYSLQAREKEPTPNSDQW